MPRVYGKAVNFKDITGQTFGRLTVLRYAGKSEDNRAMWECKCSCGTKIVTSGKSLRSGNTKSCGCLNIDKSTSRIVSLNTTHGECKTKLWHIWSGMLSRCESPSTKTNKTYQGKGIKVCEEWHSYETFRDWANSNDYKPGLTIDRIDSDGNYEPNNCRWATKAEQADNRKSTRHFTVDGETHSLAGWARKIGLSDSAIQKAVAGKTEEEAQGIVAEYARRKL